MDDQNLLTIGRFARLTRLSVGENHEPVHLARGEWQCSRVHAGLGRAEPALWHARRCLAINEAAGVADCDIASACEAMARAYLAAGLGDLRMAEPDLVLEDEGRR